MTSIHDDYTAPSKMTSEKDCEISKKNASCSNDLTMKTKQEILDSTGGDVVRLKAKT